MVLPIEFKGGYERGDTGIPYGVPEILRTAKPVYPAAFTPHQKPGWVTLDFLVKADGSIDDVKVIAMSDPVFENSAREALKGYRFGPRTIDGLPVDDRLRLTIDIAPPR